VSAGEAIAVAAILIAVAGVTAGFWLNLLLWLPLLTLKWLVLDSFVVVQSLAMLTAGTAVAVFGVLVLGLPVVAGVAAGLIISVTTYSRPSAVY
jgi:hypothetical protein